MDVWTSLTSSSIHPALLATLFGVTSVCVWATHDYNAWVQFGTGGTPANLRGYAKITKFRILRAISGDSLADASRLPTDGLSYLPKELPRRQGPAPKTFARTLPQRQYPEVLAQDISARLHALPTLYTQKYPNTLLLDKSITEGRTTDAIYAREDLPGRKNATQDPVLGNEIAHVHPAENSLHVWLTQTDTRKVVEAGWGQRFPLASLGMCDEGWTFVYAPRSMEEVDVIEEIVKAGIAHLTSDKSVM